MAIMGGFGKKAVICTSLLVLLILSTVLFSMLSSAAYAQLVKRAQLPGSNLKVSFLSQDPDPAEPGEIAELRWKVENYGGWAVKDVDVEIKIDYPFSFVSGENAVKTLSLDARQIGDKSYLLKWKLKIDDNAPESEYEIEVTYKVGDAYIKLEPFTITVKTRDIILNVEKIIMEPERAEAGKEVDVFIDVMNLADSAVDEVKVKLALDGTDFSAVGSANEKTIKKILGGQTARASFRLGVNGDASSKVHRIPMKLEYKNRFGESSTVDTSFGLIVDSPPKYILNLDETEIYTKGKGGKVIISVSNIGKSDINFVTLELLPTKEYKVISTPKVYLGNLESDDYETAEYRLFVNKGKDIVPLKAMLFFKDNFNKEYNIDEEIPLKIYSEREAVKYGLLKKSSGFGLFVFLLIIGGAGYLYYKKRYKRKTRI